MTFGIYVMDALGIFIIIQFTKPTLIKFLIAFFFFKKKHEIYGSRIFLIILLSTDLIQLFF